MSSGYQKALWNKHYNANYCTVLVTKRHHAILKQKAVDDGVTIRRAIERLIEGLENMASPESVPPPAGKVISAEAIDAVMKKHIYTKNIEGYDELLAGLLEVMGQAQVYKPSTRQIVRWYKEYICTGCGTTGKTRANNRLYCADCRKRSDALRKRAWKKQRKVAIANATKSRRWKDTSGVPRLYRKACSWCGSYFSTDGIDDEFCRESHRELSGNMRKLRSIQLTRQKVGYDVKK